MLSALEIFVAIGVIIIAISCLSIDATLRKNSKRDKEILSLLKEIALKK